MKKNIFLFALITFILIVVYYNQNTPIRFPSSDKIGLLPDNSYDLSQVEPKDFKKAMQFRVLNLLRVIETPEEKSFEFGHFLMSNDQGQIVKLCDEYPFIQLQFYAEGLAISGTPPQILATTRCVPTLDDARIEAVKINLKSNDEHTQLQILPDQVPPITNEVSEWYLNKITFYNQDNKSLILDGYQIIETLGHPIVVKLNQ